jgi:hypothetical protein
VDGSYNTVDFTEEKCDREEEKEGGKEEGIKWLSTYRFLILR